MTTEDKQWEEVDEIDLGAILAALWKRKILIVFGTLVVTLLAAAASYIIPKTYRSEAFYQLGDGDGVTIPLFSSDQDRRYLFSSDQDRRHQVKDKSRYDGIGLSIPLYKRSASQFSNPTRFLDYASRNTSFTDQEKQAMSKKFTEAKDIQKWISPLYAFSKEDSRQLAQVGKDQNNSVLGLNLAFEANTPDQAAKMVSFLGEYVRDCLMYVTLFNYISDNAIVARTSLQENENDLSAIRFELEQEQKKMADIQAVLRKYPNAANIENRQLVSIQEGGAHFLSPLTQLVGIESKVADLRREVDRLERDREKLLLLVEFFDLVNVSLNQEGKQGEPLFQRLKAAETELFAKKDLSRDTVREVFNNLNIDRQNFDRTFYTSYRFVSGPTVPTQHIKPRKSVIVLGAFFVSAFFFLFLALFLNWWQDNKKILVEKVPN